MNFKKSKRGFTLLEIVLYVALAVFILGSVVAFIGTILGAQAKNQTVAEVEQQGVQIMQLMTQSIRNADKVNSPTRGNTASTLSVNDVGAGGSPVVFSLAGGVITMQEGGGSAVQITSDRISASNLTFRNLARPATPGNVEIEFTLSRNNTGGRNEYEFTKTFLTSVSLR